MMKNKKNAFRVVWFVLLIWRTSFASAEDRFQVELIVFAQDMATTELFDQTRSEIQWPSQVVEVSALAQAATEQKSLSHVYATLSRSSTYQPIDHYAWFQVINEDSAGDAVRIQDAANVLDGFFQLERGDFLTVTLDLEYQPDPERFFRMSEARRIKFNEEHYFDHPKFGAILKVKMKGES